MLSDERGRRAAASPRNAGRIALIPGWPHPKKIASAAFPAGNDAGPKQRLQRASPRPPSDTPARKALRHKGRGVAGPRFAYAWHAAPIHRTAALPAMTVIAGRRPQRFGEPHHASYRSAREIASGTGSHRLRSRRRQRALPMHGTRQPRPTCGTVHPCVRRTPSAGTQPAGPRHGRRPMAIPLLRHLRAAALLPCPHLNAGLSLRSSHRSVCSTTQGACHATTDPKPDAFCP